VVAVAPALVLLPSPLLGPAVWLPVAERLRDTGWSATVAAVPVPARTPDEVMATFLGSMPGAGEVVLVPHSNAGLYVPGLARSRPVAASVFVDAALPAELGRTPLAPPAHYEFLATLAGPDGLLPRWTEWWSSPDVDGLFPSRSARDEVEAEQQRLPLAYFASSLPAHPGWDEAPAAYIAFGGTYHDERRRAAGRGWPVRTLTGRHLHMLVEPAAVALTLTDVLASLGVRP
jgi:hypothetical protein